MKYTFFFLGMLTSLLRAELPQLSKEKDWLGYFVGWNVRGYDYGYGADGESFLYAKKGKVRMIHDHFPVRLRIQEKFKDKWSNRTVIDRSSEQEASLNPKKPVSVSVHVKGDTKGEFLQTYSGGKIIIKPKFTSVTTKKPVRMAVEIFVRDFYRIGQLEKKGPVKASKIKKFLKADTLEAKRKKDGKKVSLKMYETDVDVHSEEMLAEGATKVELKIKKIRKTLVLEQGDVRYGKFEIKKTSKPLYRGFRVIWSIDPEHAGKKEAYMTFTIK